MFVCVGTKFIDAIDSADLRFVFLISLFLYLFLNKKMMVYVSDWQIAFILLYLIWCISTSMWSEVPILSITKSTLFAFNIIIMVSAGSLWVVKYGYLRNISWLYLVLIVSLISEFFGGGFHQDPNHLTLYSGYSANANAFGFLLAISTCCILWQIYQYKDNQQLFWIWTTLLIANMYFLFLSYSRSSIAICACILFSFFISFPLSKKMLITLSSFFCIALVLVMMPVSYIESLFAKHVIKLNTTVQFSSQAILNSRMNVWQQSYKRAIQGGIMGDGFDITIEKGDDKIQYDNAFSRRGEKGNSQLAIMEETGIVGLVLYAILLISFFSYVIPYYLRLTGSNKVAMGIVLGAIIGLLMESIVEAWWDSAAGPELICFWAFVGVVHGMIYLEKQKRIFK